MATKNPFSLYDCLGYFVPGALSVYIAIFLINVEEGNFLNAFRSVEFGSVDATIAFVIIAYILGHAVYYASSITVEKYSNWMFGYPSTFVLQGKQVPYYRRVTDEQLLDWIENNPHSKLAWLKKKMFQSN